MTTPKMTLVDWLDDLCVRFIVNLPNEELQSVERICFQVEEAQWFYEDFIRPLDPNNLPSMHLRKFSQLMFQHCPLFSAYSEELHQQAYEQFLAYKTRVPVRGAIMLNKEMTHAVLVKGWKKGARWSFPRGKINKEEADLDCAVREVYEETGFDLKKAHLVLPEDRMKKITVTMREQSMMLYVFRGVPMDAHFEPRTRKEISKIDWYKLTELPTLVRKNQAQQGMGVDSVKDISFYMVAPFLGPLKSWIKQQHKLDSQKPPSRAALARPPSTTDDEDHQLKLRDVAASTAASLIASQADDKFTDLVTHMGQDHRPSDALPELSLQPPAQEPVDPAAELKRLLSVGVGTQPAQAEAPSISASDQPQSNSLLAILQQGSRQPAGPQTDASPMASLMQPRNPHGQQHLLSHHVGNPGLPPSYPFPSLPLHNLQTGGPQPSRNGMFAQTSTLPNHPSHAPTNHTPSNAPSMPKSLNRSIQQSISQSPPDSHLPVPQRGPAIPPASNLPIPKLNAHTQELLNAFKFENQQTNFPPSTQLPVVSQAHQIPHTATKPLSSLPQQLPYKAVPPQKSYYSSSLAHPSLLPNRSGIQPEQPKPRTPHQDSLLSLFSATPSNTTGELAELSALPKTPGQVAELQPSKGSQPSDTQTPDPFASLYAASRITKATVSGPINAPDFGTVKKNAQPLAAQTSSMSQQVPSAPRSPISVASTRQNGTVQNQSAMPATSTRPVAHAQDLLDASQESLQPMSKKHAQLPSLPLTLPSPVMQRPPSISTEQKSSLLALFNGHPSPTAWKTHSSIPRERSSFPASPRIAMSSGISPASSIPPSGSLTASVADLPSRSRMSSIGDSMTQSMPVAPTSHGITMEQGPVSKSMGNLPGLGARSQGSTDGRSPVDKDFLLGFLEGVARRGK